MVLCEEIITIVSGLDAYSSSASFSSASRVFATSERRSLLMEGSKSSECNVNAAKTSILVDSCLYIFFVDCLTGNRLAEWMQLKRCRICCHNIFPLPSHVFKDFARKDWPSLAIGNHIDRWFV